MRYELTKSFDASGRTYYIEYGYDDLNRPVTVRVMRGYIPR